MQAREEEIKQEIVELEKRYWQAMKDKDADTAMRLSDDVCVLTGPQGIGQIAREQLGPMMSAANYTLEAFTIDDDVEVRLLGDDVAILAYRVHEDLTVDGERVTLDVADSSTWVRRDGQWRCALHTEAIAGDPFGRDRQIDGTGVTARSGAV